MMKPITALLLVLAAGISPAAGAAHSQGGVSKSRPAAALSREERIASQTVIEQFWYEQRIWPKENPGQKPPFEQMVPASLIQSRADDALKKSAALKIFWEVEITPPMLQAELERMARDTKDPATLRELFASLGNNATLIAETLARDLLADRLIRQKYAFDPGLHASARAKTEKIALYPSADWQSLEGTYSRQITEPDTRVSRDDAKTAGHERRLAEPEFQQLFEMTPPVSEIATVDEQMAGFLMKRTLSRSQQRIEIENLWIPKAGFNEWWDSVAKEITPSESSIQASDYVYRMPDIINASGCDEWGAMSSVNAVNAATFSNSAVWSGAEMILWGGRYNPATDSWTPTTSVGAPQWRQDYSVIWTGIEMIIWGGDLYTGSYIFYDSGGRYNPTSDSWIATSINANTPSPRGTPASVWTGSDMVIWGGWSCSGFRCGGGYNSYNNGGRYNPGSGNWLATSTGANSPGPGSSYSVWSGTEMILYTVNHRYNPDTDSWALMSWVGYPYHVGSPPVWTGKKMIVWGGYDFNSNTFLNSGAEYYPITDNWIQTPQDLTTPIGRDLASAVWTGNEMIIWGGANQTYAGYLNDGGRYNPDNRLWQPTSLTGSPSPRREHLSIWTGNRMIIWGGIGTIGTEQNTGGVYASGSVASPGNSLRGSKSSSINLNWSTIYGAGSYKVKRADLATAPYPYVPSTLVSTPTIPQYSEPDDGQSHFYAIEAVNQCGATP